MKKKKLNRDGWGFSLYPYYQMRIDCDQFHGIACLIRLVDGEPQYWETPKAGRIQVAGEGMTWLELIPDNTNRVVTIKYFPDNTQDPERKNYPQTADERYRPSIWYVDITEGIEYDENGIAVYIDKYLDVIFTPEGDVMVDDRDELDEAYEIGELSREQYDKALKEGELILEEYCQDIPAFEQKCSLIRAYVEEQIQSGAKPLFVYHGSQYDLDIIKPMQAQGESNAESMMGIYAAASAKETIPFALPIRWYPDSPEGKRSFSCSNGMTTLIYGSLNPEGIGYIYRLKSDSFNRIDGWEWVSQSECEIVEKIPVKVKDFLHTVQFSPEAQKIQEMLFGSASDKYNKDNIS